MCSSDLFENGGSLRNISVLDRVKGHAQKLGRRISSADKAKLDEYLGGVRAVETSIERMRADKDIVFIPGAKGAILDPTSDPETFTLTKMGIDATRPTGRDFAERLTIPDDQRARARSILAAAGVKL